MTHSPDPLTDVPCGASCPQESGGEAAWAWAAGLFEGEGSITYPGKQLGPGRRVRLQLKMTDEDVVRRFQQVVGGIVYGPYKYLHKDGHIRKAAWMWTSDGVDAAELLRRWWPWLGERRRARIEEVGSLRQSVLGLEGTWSA